MGIKAYSAHAGLKYKYQKAGQYSMQFTNNVSSAVFSGVELNGMRSQLIDVKNINEKFRQLGDAAFMNCSRLSSVSFCDSLSEIGASCFQGCTNLTNAPIPPGVRKIGESAFRQCNSLSRLDFKYFENDDANGDVSYKLDEIGGNVLAGAGKCQNVVLPSSIDRLSKIDDKFLSDSAVSSVTFLGMPAGNVAKIADSQCLGLKTDCAIYTSDGKQLAYNGRSDSLVETAEYSQYNNIKISRGKKDKMSLGRKIYYFAEDLFRWCVEPQNQDSSKFPQRQCPVVTVFLDLKTSANSKTFADNVLRKSSLYKWMKENLACYMFMMDRDGMVSDSESSSDLQYYRRFFSAKDAQTNFVTVNFYYDQKFNSVVLNKNTTLSEFESTLLEYCRNTGFSSFNPNGYDKIGDEPDPETAPSKSIDQSGIAGFHSSGFDWYLNGSPSSPSNWSINDDPMDFGLVATPGTTYLLMCTYDKDYRIDPVQIKTELFPIFKEFSDHAFFYDRCNSSNKHFVSGLSEGIKYRYLIFFEFSHGQIQYISIDGGVSHATLWSTLKPAKGRIFGMFDSCESGSMIVKSSSKSTSQVQDRRDLAEYIVQKFTRRRQLMTSMFKTSTADIDPYILLWSCTTATTNGAYYAERSTVFQKAICKAYNEMPHSRFGEIWQKVNRYGTYKPYGTVPQYKTYNVDFTKNKIFT